MRTISRIVSPLAVTAVVAGGGIAWAQAKAGESGGLHAVLVTYENDTPADQLRNHPDNISYAKALKKVPGLILKTWINDGKTFGGFHVFKDKASAEAFVSGDLFQNGVVKDQSNRNVQIRHFAVFPELSTMSGVPSKTLDGK